MSLVSLLPSGIWQLSILVVAVVLVTVTALLRAPRADTHRVYAAFAAAFGIRRSAASRFDEAPLADIDTEATEPGQNEGDDVVEEER